MNGDMQVIATVAILFGASYGVWVSLRQPNRGETVSIVSIFVAMMASVAWYGLGLRGGSTSTAVVVLVGVAVLIVLGFALPDRPAANKWATGLLYLSLAWALAGGWIWTGLRWLGRWIWSWLGDLIHWLGNTWNAPVWLTIALIVFAICGMVALVRSRRTPRRTPPQTN